MLGRRLGAHASYSPYRAGRRGPQQRGRDPGIQLTELPRKDGADAVFPGPSLELPAGSSSAKATGTLKRPTSLSRHASAAGFPLSGAASWTLGRSHRSPLTAASPGEQPTEGAGPDSVEDISHLLADVARFAEGLEKLKECVLHDDLLEARRPLAHECLGEALRVMRQIISKYPLLNTVETLTAAGTLIAKVKAFHYESNSDLEKHEFEKALETIAVAFSSTVSEFLMGEVDSSTLLAVPPGDSSQSMESLYGPGSEGTPPSLDDCDASCLPAEEVDVLLQRCEGGVDAALLYAKNMAKYMKDLISYLEKRTTLEMEFAKGLQKIAHNCRQSVMQEPHMPLLSIYSLALEQDLEFGHGMVQAVGTLQTQTFMQPLTLRRLEHEKRRKEIKEAWHRAQRKLQEAESNLRKAKQGYTQRCEDHDKARFLVAKAEEEQAGTTPGAGSTVTKMLDKRRRLEEEAKNKAEEAMATYRTCVADAKTQKQELEDTKVTTLRHIQEVIRQSDQTIKTATISYYQMMHMQTAPLPVHFQMLCESSKLYDPGQQYASHVRQLQRDQEPDVHYDFEPHVSANAWSPVLRARKSSFNVSDVAGPEAAGSHPEEGGCIEGAPAKERRGECPAGPRGGRWLPAAHPGPSPETPLSPAGRGHQVHKSWPLSISDSDGGLDPGPGTGDFKKFERTSSSGTMSSTEELVDPEGGAGASAFEQADLNGMTPELPVAVPSGPFRHEGLSKAARTHRLRKLRTPAKCRECNSYVYFQGAECEECCLACHKKCLETLAIQCGHKKLQGRLQLFGQDFSQAARSAHDGVPFIVKKCVCEIERRALRTKGIYRVNGVKTRVEKLCQAFENGKELVELSQASPHDISNVLKLYLRQLPEPLISFRLYHELVGLAKDSLKAEAEAKAASRGRQDGSESEAVAVAMAGRLRELLRDLPSENRASLQYLLRHLRRIVEVEQDNKMTPGNLGIVFGPTLLRPRPTEATVSLSSLVDYPHQARVIETLIVHYGLVFEEKPEETPGGQDESSSQRAEVVIQMPYLEAREGVAYPLQEAVEDGCRESRVVSNDSDSDLEEASELLSSSEASALRRLSFLEQQQSEASLEEASGSHSGSEEQLEATAREDGDEDDPAQQPSGFNTNQSNNVLQAPLPTMRLRGGQIALGSCRERQPEFL
ncbi:PREDICTED: minor histocompatibility protein HA-1 isoform X6 [Rhinopithecus bieti]|uniref:minor histocompatibility protein HA-1 isoform X6 n=1 Tax=Rhinopithecus bieti TaxID=61621 RepID=UPI00083BE068|nr:PREDICTED: minor histocompatibility protein HA-1 isoform X6 [Rhinopithecus bieti]